MAGWWVLILDDWLGTASRIHQHLTIHEPYTNHPPPSPTIPHHLPTRTLSRWSLTIPQQALFSRSSTRPGEFQKTSVPFFCVIHPTSSYVHVQYFSIIFSNGHWFAAASPSFNIRLKSFKCCWSPNRRNCQMVGRQLPRPPGSAPQRSVWSRTLRAVETEIDGWSG